MSKLKEILTRDEKQVQMDELDLVVGTAKLQVESDIIAAKKAVNAADKAFQKALSTQPFSPGAVINAKRDREDAEQDLKDLEALKAELF